MTAPTTGEQATAERMLAELHEHGYVDRPEFKGLKPGDRVKHRGEQYPEAYDQGTATVWAVVEKPDSAWSRKYHASDVELIVVRDRPFAEGMSRVTSWANYHTEAVVR
ncbi:hypothetical protein Ade02nite_20560 [Paractinoplanes deccanensis]|uniref:Uncharacterized protein n=1 Tax=Paractinoplanes deccanensis TaxID=113561 RepID=A0ABQ3Y0C4_9ACTN|nr:hypothetical protein [Actinoplanes deccanensis]GID73415.1 hypothetical protein Ade02nite_20560 [Actinoplanes deccanensis]